MVVFFAVSFGCTHTEVMDMTVDYCIKMVNFMIKKKEKEDEQQRRVDLMITLFPRQDEKTRKNILNELFPKKNKKMPNKEEERASLLNLKNMVQS